MAAPTRQLPMPDDPGVDVASVRAWIVTFKQRGANWIDQAALAIAMLQSQVSTLEGEVAALQAAVAALQAKLP